MSLTVEAIRQHYSDLSSSSLGIWDRGGEDSPPLLSMKWSKMFIGIGKMMVLLCSAAMLLNVCKYRSCKWKKWEKWLYTSFQNVYGKISPPPGRELITLFLFSKGLILVSASAYSAANEKWKLVTVVVFWEKNCRRVPEVAAATAASKEEETYNVRIPKQTIKADVGRWDLFPVFSFFPGYYWKNSWDLWASRYLQSWRAFSNNVGGLPQGSWGLLFALGGNHLQS